METFNYTIKDEHGIHARPAGLFVKEMQKFTASVSIQKGEKKADAKKLFAVMGLAAKNGDEIIITVDGADEAEAAAAAKKILEENL